MLNRISNFFFRRADSYWKSRPPEEQWRRILSGEEPNLHRFRIVFKHLPAEPRCDLCNAPFHGLGGPIMRLIGRGPSKLNPRFCRICLETAPTGGAEIELTMLFADVRGSTGLAEQLGPAKFSKLINRFFSASIKVLIQTNALIDRLVGDEVIALFIPGFVGQDHARIAGDAARAILKQTGHTAPQGPWIPIGIGIHTGTAFVGKIGEEGVTDITVLGDAANVTARLATLAGPGEILFSDATYKAAGLQSEDLKSSELDLKGRSEPLLAWQYRITPNK